MKRALFLGIVFIVRYGMAQDVCIDDVFEVQNIVFTKEIVATLSSDYLEGRSIENKSIYRTQAYLESLFRTYHIKSYFDNYRVSYKVHDSLYGQNIVGVYRGNYRKKTALLIVANYDNIGIINDDEDRDTIYNGANDNATGVAALIQLVYLVNLAKPNDNIIFALTSGKKNSMVGAGFLADTLKKYDYLKIRATMNLEMLGKPIKAASHHLLTLQDSSTNIISLFNHYLGEEFLVKDTTEENRNRSEHSAFQNVLQVPSVTITSFNLINDDNFMTSADDIANIDIDYLHKTIGRISYALLKIIDGNDKIIFEDPNVIKKDNHLVTKESLVQGQKIMDLE